MLALLALVLFPVAAQAECTTSSCATYETVVPSAGGGATKENPLNEGGHDDSGTQGEAHGSAVEEEEGEDSTGEPGSGSKSEGDGKKKHGGGLPSGDGGKNPPSSGGEGGSPSNGGSNGIGEAEGVAKSQNGEAASSSSDDGSSPVIPILVAVAVLAAISIGVVLYRQRKSGQDPDGRGSVSSSNAS